MSAPRDDLAQLRLEALRLRMQAQRLLIAERIGPAHDEDSTFPRSLTMRLLLRHPWRMAGLVASIGGQRRFLLRTAAAAVGVLVARAALRRERRG